MNIPGQIDAGDHRGVFLNLLEIIWLYTKEMIASSNQDERRFLNGPR